MWALAVLVGCSAAGQPDREAAAETSVEASAAAATSHDSAAAPNTLTSEEDAAGWRLLFDGETTTGWRGYRQSSMPEGWQVVDGALTRVASAGDIVTEEQFSDFELALEWKVSEGGNSGIFFRVTEELSYAWESGPEMQVLDDDAHRDGLHRETAAGSNYALHAAPAGVVRPVGEWNEVRIRVHGNHVEHWMNGVKVVEYELGSEDWLARVRASKFNDMPRYGREPAGHIALQDHGDWVAFRNIRIRTRLDP